jgi:cell division protein FtsW (lipid II flippase)
VNIIFPPTYSHKAQKQSRLMKLTAMFLFLYTTILSLSPAVRSHSWQVAYKWQHWVGFIVWLIGFAIVYRQFHQFLPDGDVYLLPIIALLSGFGLLTIWRLDTSLGWRQTAWLSLGLVVLWFGMQYPKILTLLKKYKYILLTGGLLLTGLTFFLGTYPSGQGPKLWLKLGSIFFQPTEPLKLLLIIYLAAYLSTQRPANIRIMQMLAPTIILMAIAIGMLLAQRDLGTTTIFILIYFIIVYLASGRKRILIIGLTGILAAGLLGYFLFDVIQLRVNAWIHTWQDPNGVSYQIVQSLIAIASGGIFGSGPGIGNPGLVPIAHSDFIFTAIGEETGLFGTVSLVLTLSLLLNRGYHIMLKASNTYHRFLAAGISTYLALQSIMIIGGNLRLIPLTGVTLPFISYGGSSLLTVFCSVLLLMLISNTPEDDSIPLEEPLPYQFIYTGLLAVFGIIALTNVWWSVIQSDKLTKRADNYRLAIADQYVPRGSILDRKNQPISFSYPENGVLTRVITHPAASHITGYSHPIYGQTNLEASLDGFLRGQLAVPSSMIWTHELLYSQHPPGLDIRLSIDLDIQRTADELMILNPGALVLLNAQSGEVLAVSSFPYINPNKIEEQWSTWIQDESAPLLNRATQGQYPIGTALAPFLYARLAADNNIPPIPNNLSAVFNDATWPCTVPPQDTTSWGSIITSGCPGAAVTFGLRLPSAQIEELYRQLGLETMPEIRLPTAKATQLTQDFNRRDAVLGQEKVLVTPLQMALASAALSTNGERPYPIISMAVDTPAQGWIVLPSGSPTASIPEGGVLPTVSILGLTELPTWYALGSAHTSEGQYTWYLGGTRPNWNGTPIAIALILEDDNPELAKQIGDQVINSTLNLNP